MPVPAYAALAAVLLLLGGACRPGDVASVGDARAQPRPVATARPVAATPAPGPRRRFHTATGAVASYDATGRVLVLQSALGDTRFVVAPEARLWIGSGRAPVERLATSRGAQATVAYSEVDGVATTHTVRLARGRADRER